MSRVERRHDYVVVGHVTRDIVPATGAVQIGGSAFYSGLQAARLGLRTRIVTAGDPGEIGRLIEPYAGELEIDVQPAAESTCFEAIGVGPQRSLRLISWAGAIEPPADGFDTEILHLAPVARETGRMPTGSATFVGLTPQGMIRRWDAGGLIRQVPLAAAELPGQLDALVISDTERAECARAVDAALAGGAVVSVTAGRDGAEVLSAAGSRRAPALEIVAPVEDLGAGDVYATAFFVALAGGLDAATAMQRGQAAAFHRLNGEGPGAVATASRIAELTGGL